MGLKLIRGATFRALERRLLDDLSELDGVPVWVVAPTAGVANHLRQQVLGRAASKVLAGIRMVPLSEFVDRLTVATGIAPGVRRGPLLDLLLDHLCQQARDLDIAQSMARIRSGSRFLMPTFRDLGDGGFGRRQTELLVELARQPDLGSVESEVLYLYVRWLELLEQAEVEWAPVQVQKLAEELEELSDAKIRQALAGEQQQNPQVFFHGFYEFTDVNTQLLAALSRRVPTRLYYPFAADSQGKGSHPAFAFAAPVLEDLRFRLGAFLEGVEDLEDPSEAPAQFFLRHYPEGYLPDPPSFLSWQSASGARAEALSAALRIRRWLDEDESLQPSDILIAAPDVAPYLSVLPGVFRDFALPLRISSAPGSPAREEMMLRSLGRLWEEGAESEWVLSHLRDFASSKSRWAPFEEKVRARGLAGGDAWRRALEASEGWSDPQRHRLEHLAHALSLEAQSGPSRWTPQQALDHLASLEQFWLDGSDEMQILKRAIEKLSRQLPDLSVPQDLLRDWLLESGSQRQRSDAWNRQGALFTPLMRSRGLTARRLVLLGLACGRLPFRIEQDPLLSDESRRRLAAQARDVGHRLPVKTRAAEEQTLLFLLLNTSAEWIHWVIPESDEEGRKVAPTPWVQRFLHHWDSEWPQSAGRFEKLLRGPRQQALQMLHADAARGGLLPPRSADLLGFRQPAQRPAPDRQGPRRTVRLPSLSVTALESLSRCPFRFYARFAASLTPLEPLSPFRQPTAQLRGQLLHRALELLLTEPLLQGASLPAAARGLLRNGAQKLKEGVRQAVEEAFSESAFPHQLMRQACTASLTRTLSDYFRSAADEQKFYLDSLEARFRRSAPELAGTAVSGKIDRVDVGDFQQRRIIDYKSGKKPAQLESEAEAGFRLQPTLYPWLCASAGPSGTEAAFAYVFLGDDPPRTHPLNDAPPASPVLLSLACLLQEGCFFPTPNEAWQRLGLGRLEPCRGCQMASLCRRHSPGTADRSKRLFEEKALPRLQHLRGVSRKDAKTQAEGERKTEDGERKSGGR